MPTSREIADRFLRERQAAWDKNDPTTAIIATEELGPEDVRAIRRIVQESGYEGDELERLVRQVSALVVGRVEALADKLPATEGD
jgi:hypothetical protein